MEIKYKPNTKKELKALCDNKTINLGEIDTSKITAMSCLFYSDVRKDYSGIENWDVSKVTDMSCMFWGAENFNADISNWDVSNVTDMSGMFDSASSFNQDLSKWDVSKVENMYCMFFLQHLSIKIYQAGN